MRLFIVSITITLIACSDDCSKISPNPDTSLGWMPFHEGNYWKYDCDPGCGSDYSPYVKDRISFLFTADNIDTLEFAAIYFDHFNINDGYILAKSTDGMRLYKTLGINNNMSTLWQSKDYESFIKEFNLFANFQLNQGQMFNSGGSNPTDVSVTFKSDDEIHFSNGMKYRKGLGFISVGNSYYEEIMINEITYNLKCR